MAYTTTNFKTKAALKAALKAGNPVQAYNYGLGPDLTGYTGTVYLEGPHYPAPHSWYAQATMKDGNVISVK